jgi:hypothetical protein
MKLLFPIIRDAIGFLLFVGIPVALVVIAYYWSK